MASELSPGGSKARMTKSQVKKYIKNMKKAQALAEQKIKDVESSGEIEKDKKELKKLEDLLE